MPKFSAASEEKLKGVHPSLAQLLRRVVAEFDMVVLSGVRTKEEQQELFNKGASKTLNSKHLVQVHTGYGHAVDVAPYPIDWNNTAPYYYMAGRIQQLAMDQGLKIRWGGDWDMDREFDDEKFLDLVHFEILT